MPRMPSSIIARARALIAELDALASEVQDVFDDASADAYSGRANSAYDYLDGLYDAAASAHATTARLRAAIEV